MRNETTAVDVEYEPADESLEVYVVKLRNGRKPSMDEAWDRHWALVSQLAEQYGGGAPLIASLPERSEAAMDSALAGYAETLARFRDVLDGDFGRFDALERREITETDRFDVNGYDPGYPETAYDPGPYRDSLKRWLRGLLRKITR
jgi:hypothetical protein